MAIHCDIAPALRVLVTWAGVTPARCNVATALATFSISARRCASELTARRAPAPAAVATQVEAIPVTVGLKRHIVADRARDDCIDVDVDVDVEGESDADPSSEWVGENPNDGVSDRSRHPLGLFGSGQAEMGVDTDDSEVEPGQGGVVKVEASVSKKRLRGSRRGIV